MATDEKRGRSPLIQATMDNLFKVVLHVFDAWFTGEPEARRMAFWHFGEISRKEVTEIFPGIRELEQIALYNPLYRRRDASVDLYEVAILCGIARFIGATRVCEIGTFDGNTTLNLAANMPPDGQVVTIDLPPDFKGEFELNVPPKQLNVTDRNITGIQYRTSPYRERVEQVLHDSFTLDWDTIGGPFDIVFIDGCHFSPYVKKDTENALRHMTRKGLIIWHDYGYSSDVSSVVDGYRERFPIEVVRGTRLAIGFTGGRTSPPGESSSDTPSRDD